MKLFKKGLTIVAGTLCLASMALTGCGGNNTASTNAATTDSASTDAAAPASTEKVDILWYAAGTSTPEDMPKVLEEANKYLEEKGIPANLKIEMYDFGTFPDKLQTAISSGEEFDICFTCNWCNDYFVQARKGAYVPLNDDKKMLETYAPQTKALLGDDFLAGSQIDGINYAIPANKEKAHQWGFLVLKQYADKYNMDFSNVKSLADMEPFFQTIKENEPSIYPFESLTGESAFRLLDFDTIGGSNYPGVVYNDTKDFKVFNELEAPEAREFFDLVHKYYQAGYIKEDADTITDYTQDQKAGKMFCATRSLKPGKDAEEGLSMGQEYVQVNITSPVLSNRETTGSMQAISSTSKHPDIALQVLELFNTDAYFNNLINFGIEGQHYDKVEGSENIIKPAADHDKYNLALGWAFGNQFLNYVTETEDPEKWDKFEAFNNESTPTQTLGFVFNPDNVQTEIAQCVNVWRQYMPGLETGKLDPNEVLPKAIEELKAAGSDTIIAEKQAQLDAWVAANK
ncbi:ABC transporter substrate-binding protein [Cellulosilyticum ruminicola]|uniref:ABC transporter substrate-binding protein n=1 Tax=Cellulosilyticum ruminicola TaxID=425254 RepID=UPI0006CF2E5B|nr:ABC transporter substrate-binding protein [Cellulosilyticum ruminicola]